MRVIRLLLATAALVVLPAAPAVADRDLQPPADPVYQRSEFQAQAEANHLSPEQARTLQARVVGVIAHTGGTQVAINQVAWDGGDTLIPLPEEKRAHELGVTPSARTVNGCEYYQFCTYWNADFTGMVDRMSSCVLHATHSGFLSYVNNQTPGTVAKFYNHVVNYLTDTYPAFHKGTSLDYGPQTYYVKPC